MCPISDCSLASINTGLQSKTGLFAGSRVPFAQILYRRIIKDRRIPRYLPADICPEFISQLTDEYTAVEHGRMVWKSRRKNNHLGDCAKLQEVMSGDVETILERRRMERIAAEERNAVKPSKVDRRAVAA